jgi:phage nucleotide-binding protein
MAIYLKSTKDVSMNGVKILTHGLSGAGKTWLCRTLPSPVIISAESGLLTLKDMDLPYIEVGSMSDLRDAYRWATESQEADQFESIALDSISEIGEVCLSEEKTRQKDGRAAYGEMNEAVAKVIRSFRDIKGKHVYMSAKTEKIQDDKGRILYGPSMPGKTLTNQLAYWFDMVFALRVETDQETGEKWRGLLCDGDEIWMAKNRGGMLDQWEPADLGEIIKKVAK